jgi:hypothetical protein
LEGIIKFNPFYFPKLSDLFSIIKTDEADEPEEKENEKGDERPEWVNELMDILKPKQEQQGTSRVPVPKVTEPDEEEDEEPPAPNPLKKLQQWFW